jgi:hypothetical protein
LAGQQQRATPAQHHLSIPIGDEFISSLSPVEGMKLQRY